MAGFSLLLGTRFSSSDGQVMYETSRALAFQQTIALPQDYGLPQIHQGADGRWYSQYDVGLPLLAAPVVKFTDAVARLNLWHRYGSSAYFVHWLPVLFAGSGLGFLYQLAFTLYGKTNTSLMITFAAGLASPLLLYARVFFAEGVLAGLLMMAVYAGSQGRGGWAGLALGLAILIRASMVIYLLPLWWLSLTPPLAPPFGKESTPSPNPFPLAKEGEFTPPPPSGGLGGGVFLLFPIFAILSLFYHNWLRYGDFFRFGYAGQRFDNPLWEGLAGFLVSPDKSVFLYAPPLLLSVAGFPRFWQRSPRLAQTILVMTLIALPFYSSWWAWGGGWSWGARFFVPLMPLWMLPLGEKIPSKAVWGLIWLGFGINLVGSLTDVNVYYSQLAVVHYNGFEGSAILTALDLFVQGKIQPLGTFQLASLGWLPLPAFGLPMLLGGVWLWIGKSIKQEMVKEHEQ